MNRFLQFLYNLSTNNLIKNQSYLVILALFSCSILMDYHEMIWKNPFVIGVLFILVVLIAVNFRFWWAALLIITVNLVVHAPKFPRLANHSNLEVFACILFLAIFIVKMTRPGFRISPHAVSGIFRISLVTIYFYTGFHKLNTDFFNPCVSCVNQINEIIFENFTGKKITLSGSASTFFQYTTLFVEMILPFGLFSKTTRKYTAMLLLFFHFYLAFVRFVDFSAFATFMIVGCVIDFKKTTLSEHVLKGLKTYLWLALSIVFLKPIFYYFNKDYTLTSFIYGIIFNIATLYFFVTFFKDYVPQKHILKRRHIILFASGFLLISTWSLKSYLGYGNSANLTMFSNLLTEQKRSNHLFIDTKKTKIVNFEEDNLLIVDIHDTVKKYGLEGYKIPMIEFKYKSNAFKTEYPGVKINCTFVYKNDTIIVPDLANSDYSQTKWWYQYLNFRKFKPDGANECLW